MVEMVDITGGSKDRVTLPPPSTGKEDQKQQKFPSREDVAQLTENFPPQEVDNMAALSTPIDEVMDTPAMMMNQHNGMGINQDVAPVQTHPARPNEALGVDHATGPYPMNLNAEQIQALIAGLAATIAFSRPLQTRLAGFVPQAFEETGGLSTVGMIITALIAAIIFYLIKKNV